jgi:hypothetical protein
MTVTIAGIEQSVEAAVVAVEARVKVLEAGAEADLVKVKAFYAKVVAYLKTGGGLAAIAAAGFAAAKFDVVTAILKFL